MYKMSIDASTKSTGVAIFDDKNELVFCTCITSSNSNVLNRILYMTKEIQQLYLQYNVKRVVLEDVRPDDVAHNQKVFNSLHYLQAALVLMFYMEEQEVELIGASSWRSKCGIKQGRGVKRETVKLNDLVFAHVNYTKLAKDINDDIADAVCIGHAIFKT